MTKQALPLHFDETGNGRPMVIVPGLFGSTRNWRSVASCLANRYRVITVDQRNHGESPHADEMDFACMAADVQALADSLGLTEPILLGHSMGGKTAMVAALLSPQRWRRLIVVDIAPVTYRQRFSDLVDAMMSIPVETLKNRAHADAMLAPVEPDPAIRNFLLHNLVAAQGHYRWRINLSAIRSALHSLRAFPVLEKTFAGPTVFIRGERSHAISPEHGPTIKALFPDSRTLTIPGAGHWPHTESPDAFLHCLAAALEV